MTSMLRNQSPATNENDIRMRSNRPGKDNKESKESKDNQAAQQQQQQGQQNQQPEGGSSQPSSPAHTRDRGLAKKCCFCWCCAPPCFSKYVLSETSLSFFIYQWSALYVHFCMCSVTVFFGHVGLVVKGPELHNVQLLIWQCFQLSSIFLASTKSGKVKELKFEVHDLPKYAGAYNNFSLLFLFFSIYFFFISKTYFTNVYK